MPRSNCVLIALMSLAAEGTPRLALDLSREWITAGMRPIIIVLQSEPDDLTADFDALGLERITLDLSDRGYTRYLILAWQTFRIAYKHRAIALLSMPLGWHALMAIGARFAGVGRVITHVGNYPNVDAETSFRKFKFLVHLGRPFTYRLVCCSRYVQSGAIRHFGVREPETATVYNGIRLDNFRLPARARSIPSHDEPIIIGMVARLEIHKDQPTLIRAARILKERGRNIRVRLIGDGSRRQELEQLVEREGLTDIVEFLGAQKNIAGQISQMHVFAFSTTPDEGLGIVLIEAMASGLPIIASDVGACREVLDNGRLGTLVAPADPIALADAIDTVRTDTTAASARARLAQQKAALTFSIGEMARRYADLLDLPVLRTYSSTAEPKREFAV